MSPYVKIQPSRMTAILLAAALALPIGLAATPGPVAAQALTEPPLTEPHIERAIDGILAAFKTHPLVGLSDAHSLAELEDFHAAIIRDPRFAREVGNVVVEFGGAQNQALIDRYLAGEAVPYLELRKVWSDVAGTAANTAVGYANFYAQVRATNLTLPPDQRIRVWLGEPPIDWSKINTQEDARPIIRQRTSHAAEVIDRNILSRNRKALVIYGGAHFSRATPEEIAERAARDPNAPPRQGSLLEQVEARRPGAFFIVTTYEGFLEEACSTAFEAQVRAWPTPALAAPVRGTTLQRDLRRPGCHTETAPPRGELTQAQLDRMMAREEDRNAGLHGDALLFLGPAGRLTRAPRMPDFYLDPAYRQEISRRGQIMLGAPPLSPVNMQNFTATPRPWRDYDQAAVAARDESDRLAAFKSFDRNGDGKLDKPEYRDVLVVRGVLAQLDSLFTQRDVDKDGFVSAAEYSRPIQ